MDLKISDVALVGQRLDKVASNLSGIPRSRISQMLTQKQVLLNNNPADATTKISLGDFIKIMPPDTTPTGETFDLPVVYEDNDILVVDKPIGLLSHSKGAYNPEPTVATMIAKSITDGSGDRAGIVHRLDRTTSGVMICAKTELVMKKLQKQFHDRKVNKTYQAIVAGSPAETQAIIDMPIARNRSKPKTFCVSSEGKPAKTAYKVLKTAVVNSQTFSLVEFRPQTGRTHQIRVHSTSIGCPIVGDLLYGGIAACRVFLHANKLDITVPSGERKIFTSPVPGVFAKFMESGKC